MKGGEVEMYADIDRALRYLGPVEPLTPLAQRLDATSPSDVFELWAEDVCWQAQLVEWSRRRPSWWKRSARRTWEEQLRVLLRERRALRARAEAVLGEHEE